jgi:tetratricopeptide (TPR) repeat protein
MRPCANSLKVILHSLLLTVAVCLSAGSGTTAAHAASSGQTDLEHATEQFSNKEFLQASQTLLRVAQKRRLAAGELQLLGKCYYNLGVIAWKENEVEKAARLFSAALESNPRSPGANYAMGLISEKAGNYHAAVRYYNMASQLGPSLRSRTRTRMQTMGEALLNEVARDLKDGNFQVASGKLHFAGEHFGRVLKPESQRKWESLKLEFAAARMYMAADEYARKNRTDKAAAVLRELTEKYPDTDIGRQTRDYLFASGRKAHIAATATGFRLSSDWGRDESEHFIVFSQKGSNSATFLKEGEKAIQQIMADLGITSYPLRRKIKMYLFEDIGTWREFLAANSDRTTHWSAGFAVPLFAEIYLYATERSRDLRKRVMPHELTHMIHWNYIGLGRYQPLWLTEGLARCQEEDGIRHSKRLLDSLSTEEGLIPLATLFTLDVRRSSGAAIGTFYAESAMLVDLIKDEYGSNKLLELMQAFASGDGSRMAYGADFSTNPGKVIRSVLGTDVERLEKMWLKRMGK